MKSHSKELRECVACKNHYEHEPVIINGKDFMAAVTHCEPCSEAYRRDDALKTRESDARDEWERVVDEKYRDTDTSDPRYPKTADRSATRWLNATASSPFMGLVGASGLGKTRVISQMVKILIWNGHSVCWMNSSSFQWASQNQFDNTHGSEAKEMLRRYRDAKHLVFDDIGRLKTTERICDDLYDLLETRSARGTRMMWTSNEDTNEIMTGKAITAKARTRIISRLEGYSQIIEL